ncbi:MAG TPA: hypothetical protein VFZ78_12355 [Flavisolibacter sp.]
MTPEQHTHQLLFEIRAWKRLLLFFRQENMYFKERLAELVAGDISEQYLADAESFHEEFISLDCTICFLLDDVRQQEKIVAATGVPEYPQTVLGQQMQIRTDMLKAEIIFFNLKDAFHNYQLKELQPLEVCAD